MPSRGSTREAHVRPLFATTSPTVTRELLTRAYIGLSRMKLRNTYVMSEHVCFDAEELLTERNTNNASKVVIIAG